MANISAPTITLRGTKGSPLTNTEVDNNFSNISTALQTGLTAASYTAADVLSKLNSVSGPTQAGGVNADTVTFASGARSATNLNTGNTIVARDSSGNFTAATITAATTFSGPLSSSAVTITGGTITGLSAALPIASGGTGATTQAGAQTALALVPGTNVLAYTATGAALASTTSATDTAPYFTGSGTASTHSFTSYMRGLAGSADASTARSNLGLTIGTNVQAYGAQLSAVSSVATGMVALTGAGTAAGRTITAGSGISVTNGDGTAGNPTISANVLSVQGNTGNVIVSVPVTSVQGNTGAVIVSSVSYASIAGSAQGGWPGSLSQFSNNLGNYGGWVPHNTKAGNHTNGSVGRFAGGVGNCGNISPNCLMRTHLDTGSTMDAHYHHNNCHNCNCNCNC